MFVVNTVRFKGFIVVWGELNCIISWYFTLFLNNNLYIILFLVIEIVTNIDVSSLFIFQYSMQFLPGVTYCTGNMVHISKVFLIKPIWISSLVETSRPDNG